MAAILRWIKITTIAFRFHPNSPGIAYAFSTLTRFFVRPKEYQTSHRDQTELPQSCLPTFQTSGNYVSLIDAMSKQAPAN